MPIHSTAVVDPAAIVDPSAEIGPYVVIDGPVRIGPGTSVAPYVYLKGHTEIGARCRIFSHAVIGEIPQDRTFAGGVSYCKIGDETVIREGVTIHRGTQPESSTTVGARCFLMANSHVGHNCVLGDDVNMANGTLLAGYVHVGARAFLSGNAAIHQFVRLGELAMIGGLTKITQDVPPFFIADDRGICLGVNTVGLKRAGYSSADRLDARQAYRLLYRSGLPLQRVIQEIESAATSEVGRRIVDFLRAPSRRGLTPGPRRISNTPEAVAAAPAEIG